MNGERCECNEAVHVFECIEGDVTPPETRCLCGGVTWDEMNRRLVITESNMPAGRN